MRTPAFDGVYGADMSGPWRAAIAGGTAGTLPRLPLRLVVGQRTLNPLGEVRILEGQPPPGPGRTRRGTIPRLRGDVVKWFNTEVCKTSIHRFESGRRLHILNSHRA
jgi:hypothetical protein